MPPGPDTRSIKADLARIVAETIRERGLTQADAAEILGATQPDVSDLTRGKLDRFSVERLMRFVGALGMEVHVRVGPSGPAAGWAGSQEEGLAAGGRIPEPLRRYFWDYDPETLRVDADRDTIVGRLLAAGGLDAVEWLRSVVGDDEIRAVLERRRGRGLSPRRLRFWAIVLRLPSEQVDEWVEAARRNPWTARRWG